MKTTEILGYFREDTGKASTKKIRREGNVPCVLYGGEGNPIHFHAPMFLFREVLYTPNAYIVTLNIEGNERKCILQDVQFHPVSEVILHADFLEIFDDKPVIIDIPVELVGVAPGAQAGGQVYIKNKRLKVKALPANLPETVKVDISTLELNSAARVKDVEVDGFEILNAPAVAIVQIIVPRALKAAEGVEGEEDEELEGEGAEAGADAPAEGAAAE